MSEWVYQGRKRGIEDADAGRRPIVYRTSTGLRWRYGDNMGLTRDEQRQFADGYIGGYARAVSRSLSARENPLEPEQYALIGIGLVGLAAVLYHLNSHQS
jgi:hypothetical protein